MTNKLFIVFVATLLTLGSIGVAVAAPGWTYHRTLLPESDNAFDLGTTTQAWRNIYTNDITISGTCTGCGSSGTVSTSTVPTVGQLAYWTSNAFPSLLGSVATTSVTCGGNTTCTAFTAIGGSPITISSTGGGTGLSTTSPISSSNLLVYSSAGAGAAFGVATGTIANGTGISVTAGQSVIGSGLTITNTAPDQTVAFTNGTGISVTGTYPNFTVTNSLPQTFSYPFPSNATSTLIDFSGGIKIATLSGLIAGNSGTLFAVSTTSMNASITGLAGTATALAADGADCSAGSFPLGVNASGAVVNCTDAWTEAENTAAGYTSNTGTVTSIATTYPLTGGTITTSGTLGLAFGTTTANTWAETQTFAKAINVTEGTTATSTFAGNVKVTGNLQVDGMFFAPVTLVSSGNTTINGDLTVTGATTLATSLTGLLKAASGVVSVAGAGTDYENPLTFSFPLIRSTNAISFGGLSTSSPLTAGLLYATGVNTMASVATSSAIQMSITGNAGTVTNGVYTTDSGTVFEVPLTAGDGLTRTANDFDCDTASGTIFGCLSSADWTTFNNKQAALGFTPISNALTKGNFLVGNDAGTAQATSTIFISSTGHVGIGTISPNLQSGAKAVTVSGGTSGDNRAAVEIQGSRTINATFGAIRFYNQTTQAAAITADRAGADDTASLAFFTKDTGPGVLTAQLLISSTGNVGIGTSSPATKLDVNGTITQLTVKSCTLGLTTDALGSITGCVSSDERLKTGITSPDYSALSIIGQLNPVQYKWKNTANRDALIHSGFVAQEVEKVFPSAVVNGGTENGEVMKAVDPNAINALLVKGMKEQQAQIEKLQAEIKALRNACYEY